MIVCMCVYVAAIYHSIEASSDSLLCLPIDEGSYNDNILNAKLVQIETCFFGFCWRNGYNRGVPRALAHRLNNPC